MQRNMGDSFKEQVARTVVQNMIRKGVKLLALDFDLTIIGIHTRGAWRGLIQNLAQHVRPCFKLLIEAALDSKYLHVCIVTYSLQGAVIEDLLRYILPNSDTGKILICTSSKDWLPKGNQPSKHSLGKQQHIAQVTTDLYNLRRAVIHPHEVLLMDDDEENINMARHFGHMAYLVKETVTLEDIYAYVEKMKGCNDTYSCSNPNLQEPCYSVQCNSKFGHNDRISQKHGAPVYLMPSSAESANQRQELAASEMLPPSSFTIPRPLVANEQPRRNLPHDAKPQRMEFDIVQQNSAGYFVVTNGV